ncbi:hypothetical protein B7P43_G17506 [Cryptotermes secundus]|uniref:Uncharacterized protein n=1 Tax=Cryptotermes secundus TaxID=105785 RepID=A0A2J7PPG6_9NEOP|nr:hypothetical protein B7P43_G17506 [Cryptotermes secundus]
MEVLFWRSSIHLGFSGNTDDSTSILVMLALAAHLLGIMDSVQCDGGHFQWWRDGGGAVGQHFPTVTWQRAAVWEAGWGPSLAVCVDRSQW